MLVGVVSDTHGRLSERVRDAFADVEHIIHAGDIGGGWILDRLKAIAPVTAVRGNTDRDELEWRLNDRAVVDLAGHRILVFHEPDTRRGPVQPGVDIVVNGHTHRSRAERVNGVLFVNPGSAGMRGRDGRGPTVAVLDLSGDVTSATIIDL